MGALFAMVWRGVRARGLLTAGSVVLAALAIGSAVLGPIFATASTNSFLVTRLDEAPNTLTGLSWQLTPSLDVPDSVPSLERAAARATEPRSSLYADVQTALTTADLAALSGEAHLLSKPDACEHIRVAEGRCPSGPGEAMLLVDDLGAGDVAVGDDVPLRAFDVGDSLPGNPPDGAPVATVTIVGAYLPDAASADYWFDLSRLASRPQFVSARGNVLEPYRPAPFLVTEQTITDLGRSLQRLDVDRRFVAPADLSEADLAEAAADVRRLQAEPARLPEGTLEPRSTGLNDLGGVLAEAREQQGTAARTIAPAVLSVVLVALVLLLRLLMAAASLRIPELALASLRGLPSRRLWSLGMAEPLMVLMIALPLGMIAGPAGARLLTTWWLVDGLPLPLPVTAFAIGLLVTAFAVGIAALAVSLVLRSSLAGQLTGIQRPRPSGRWALLGFLVLSAATVVLLLTHLTGAAGSGDPDITDLLLPVILAAFAGVVTTRVVAWLARARARRSSRSLTGYVVARALARRSEGTLVILPLAIALAIAVFGVGVYASAAQWRASVAATRAPSAAVWFNPDARVEQAVGVARAVDPSGEHLMGGGTLQSDGPRFTVVDGPRMASVLDWSPLWTPGSPVGELATAIAPPERPPTITGRRFGLTASADTGDPLTAAVTLRTPDGGTRTLFLDPFGPGRGTTVAAPTPYCADGCTLDSIVFGGVAAGLIQMNGTIRVLAVEVDGRPAPDVLSAGGWTESPTATAQAVVDSVRTDGDGLVVQVRSGQGTGFAPLAPGDVPRELPVVAGREASLGVAGGGSAGFKVPVRPVATSESIPLLGPTGVLVDATMLYTDRAVPTQDDGGYVFVAEGTPAAQTDRLTAAGFGRLLTLSGEERTLGQSAYALALRLYAVIAVLVVLMAAAGLLVSTAVQLPARRRDAAAMRVVGVSRRSVLVSVALEFVTVLAAAAVAGIVAGSVAQYVVLRSLTLGYVEGLATPRVIARVDPAQVGWWTLACVLALGAVAVGAGLATIRGARGATLRETAR